MFLIKYVPYDPDQNSMVLGGENDTNRAHNAYQYHSRATAETMVDHLNNRGKNINPAWRSGTFEVLDPANSEVSHVV